jgi:hypothetical protein
MARCPLCGAWLWSRLLGGFGSEVCSKCGAKIGTDPNDMFGRNLIVLQYPPGFDVETGDSLTEADARARWRRDHPNYYQESQDAGAREKTVQQDRAGSISDRSSFRGDKAKWGHCNHCHAVIMLSNAKFCSNCGSSLRHGLEDATPYGEEEKANAKQRASAEAGNGEKCMVCHLELSGGDDVVWCPNCGNPAHRNHLLEWIHVRNCCPVCRMNLREKDF